MKSIIFNTNEVKAVLDGRKTQFRIPIKLPLDNFTFVCFDEFIEANNGSIVVQLYDKKNDEFLAKNPAYQIGETIFVRETWNFDDETERPYYKADFEDNDIMLWKPSVQMPEEHARIFLKIKDVRVERLRDITLEDAMEEGCHYQISLTKQELNKKVEDIEITDDKKKIEEEHIARWWIWLCNKNSKEGYKWKDNPFVFIFDFEIEKNMQ